MKIDQPFVPSTLLTQEKKVEANAPSASSNAHTAAGSSNDKLYDSQGSMRAQYPQASPEELVNRNKRAAVRFNPPKVGVKLKPPKPKTPAPSKPKPAKPKGPTPKPAGGSNGPGGALNIGNNIASLQQSNAFPPVSPSAATTVRNAFLTAGTNNLVNSPFTVGQQMASSVLQERIDTHSKMPGAEVNKPDGTKGTVDPAASPEQKMQARLTGAELNTETLTNTIILINEGPDAAAVGVSPNAPTDTQGRLTNLEKRMGAIEGHMPDIAKRYGLVYTPYVAPESSEAPTDTSRMENIEKRYAYMNKMIKKLVAAKQIEVDAD
ncbi:type III secretion effector protein [Pseudomonas sp. AM4(2022)]|uniref:type III secretion effector protein n=1 Tax=Pseudomonas sp. AM4(2022) TaxID=2983408 RepID=UPI002E7FDEC2|nr:type III secretion effector protein [Pseudomonas sp. AM4(2022)]